MTREEVRPRRPSRLLLREGAAQYLSLTLLSFGLSVGVTRLFLSMAGYPQLGGAELHIAHVLWGGLLLYAAALLPLLFSNRGVYSAAALLAGTGVGLFIDEIGKFITQKNDYFFPIAASIIYVLFLLTLLALIQIRRAARTRARDQLTRIFEDTWEALHHTLPATQFAGLRDRLEIAARLAPTESHANLARALLTVVDAEAAPPAMPVAKPTRSRRAVRRLIARLFSQNSLRIILILGLVGLGLVTLKDPVTILLGSRLPPAVLSVLTNMRMGRYIDPSTAAFWSSVRLGLEVLVGVLLLTSAGLLLAKRNRLGAAAGYLALLLSLTTLDVLLFYFEQFSTIITTTFQVLLWIGIIIYRRHKV